MTNALKNVAYHRRAITKPIAERLRSYRNDAQRRGGPRRRGLQSARKGALGMTNALQNFARQPARAITYPAAERLRSYRNDA